jgi:tetratricopeptide (TPR) repeat protein
MMNGIAKRLCAYRIVLLSLLLIGARCVAQNNYDDLVLTANRFLKQGNLDEARQTVRQAIKQDRRRYEGYVLEAKIAAKQGSAAEAKEAVQRALALAPDDESKAKIQQVAAMIMEQSSSPASLQPAVKLSDEDQLKHDGLLRILENAAKSEHADERNDLYRQFLSRSLEFAAAHSNVLDIWVGRAYAAVELDYPGEGWVAGRRLKALGAVHSDNTKIHDEMVTLESKGWLDLQRTYRDWSKWNMDQIKASANGGDAEAQDALGCWYGGGQLGLMQDNAVAVNWYRKAADQGDTEGQNGLAWLLATSGEPRLRDGTSALIFAQKAVAATMREDPYCLGTLAAAYAETGQFARAVSVQQEALALLADQALKNEFTGRLQLYQANTPYHEALH